jgi:hypothetical protein
VQSPQGVYISSYQDNWQNIQGDAYVTLTDFNTTTWQDGCGGSGVSQYEENLQVVDNYTWPATSWPQPLPNGTDNYVVYYFNGYGIAYSNTFAADPPSLAMEQCNISQNNTDASQGWWENYSKTAHAEVKLATGGMIGSTSMNLWVISASATKYLPPWLNYPLASANIPSQQISILGKTLGADGNLYLLLPDNTNLDITPVIAGAPDYYTFNITTQKYTLTITANNIDLSTNTPEFCVGQKVTFQPAWNGSTDPLYGLPNVSDAVALWTVPGTFVNDQPDPNNRPAFYDEDRAKLNPVLSRDHKVSTEGWFADGPGGACRLNMDIYFSNGQIVFLQAWGAHRIYRPTVDRWVLFNYGQPELMIHDEKLSLGNCDNNNNGMSFQAFMQNTNGGGHAGFTQLISGEFNNGVIPVTLDGYELDGTEWIRGTQQIHTQVLSPVPLDDQPSVGLSIAAHVNFSLAFEDYLRFRPSVGNESDNIYVTLRLVTWIVNASATYDNILGWQVDPGGALTGPYISNSDEFPTWIKTF